MNQPELGNYIAQLRKEQGLTQEELVEKCNINVRTIQRIENGDVTPRSYTIKNILEALGKSIDDVFQKEAPSTSSTNLMYNKTLLGWGTVAGICYLILSTVNTFIGLSETFFEPVISIQAYVVSTIIEFVVATVFMIAIAHYGILNQNSLIKNAAYFAIAFLIVFYVLDNLSYANALDYKKGLGFVVGFSYLFLNGLMYFFIAVGFFIQRVKLGELAKWTGIIGMVGGISFCLFVLFPVGIIATLAFEVLLIILLYKAWETPHKNPLNN